MTAMRELLDLELERRVYREAELQEPDEYHRSFISRFRRNADARIRAFLDAHRA